MCGPLRGCIHQLRTQSVSTSCQWKKTRHTHQNTYKIGKCIKTLPTQVDIYVKIFTIQSLWCYQIGTVHIEGMRWTNIPSGRLGWGSSVEGPRSLELKTGVESGESWNCSLKPWNCWGM
jgi:hypothetical protein